MKEERRFSHKIEARADEEGKRSIEGVAALIDSVTVIYGEYEEVIRAGAFDAAIESSDIRILKNHNSDNILGRYKSGQGTGRVMVDSDGHLAFSVPVRDSRNISVDTYDEVITGDLDGCSFAFRIGEEKWTWPDEENKREMPLREILSFKEIYDVGPVTYPAYPETSVQARSLEEVRKENQPEKISGGKKRKRELELIKLKSK